MSNNESGYLIVSELWLSDKIKYGIYNWKPSQYGCLSTFLRLR
jgi:hypothetical protein